MILLKEPTFQREGSPYLVCNDRNAFFTSEKPKKYHAWSCQNVCDALTFLLDNSFIRFGTKLYRQVVGIPMGTNCAPLVADLFLFCYERDFMMSLLMISRLMSSETPIICYKYNKPIRSTIFNCNKIVNDIDIDSNTPAS